MHLKFMCHKIFDSKRKGHFTDNDLTDSDFTDRDLTDKKFSYNKL